MAKLSTTIQKELSDKIIADTTAKITNATQVLTNNITTITITIDKSIGLSAGNLFIVKNNANFTLKYQIDSKDTTTLTFLVNGAITEAILATLIDCDITTANTIFRDGVNMPKSSDEYPCLNIEIIGRKHYPNSLHSVIPAEVDFLVSVIHETTETNAIEQTEIAEINQFDMLNILQKEITEETKFIFTIWGGNKKVIMLSTVIVSE